MNELLGVDEEDEELKWDWRERKRERRFDFNFCFWSCCNFSGFGALLKRLQIQCAFWCNKIGFKCLRWTAMIRSRKEVTLHLLGFCGGAKYLSVAVRWAFFFFLMGFCILPWKVADVFSLWGPPNEKITTRMTLLCQDHFHFYFWYYLMFIIFNWWLYVV